MSEIKISPRIILTRIVARLAMGKALDELYTVSECQNTVKTSRLRAMLDDAREELKREAISVKSIVERMGQSKWVPHNAGTDLPIDHLKVTKFESVEVLIVSGGEVESCEFSCGPHPTPWYAFGHYHAGFVTHWMAFPPPPVG